MTSPVEPPSKRLDDPGAAAGREPAALYQAGQQSTLTAPGRLRQPSGGPDPSLGKPFPTERRLPNGETPTAGRQWCVVGPMGSDEISYDPPDIEYAERIIVEVEAPTRAQAKTTALAKLRAEQRHTYRDLMDVTRGANRNPYAALIPVEMIPHDCARQPWYEANFEPEDGTAPDCSTCDAFGAAFDAAIAILDRRYPP